MERTIARARAVLGLLPALWRGTPLERMQRQFYGAVYEFADRLHFMNFGFAPTDPAMPRPDESRGEPYQAALYHEVLREGAAVLGHPPMAVVEVACGAGGGLMMAGSLFPDAVLLGFDRQPRALRAAAGLLGRVAPGRGMVVAADGLSLPLGDAVAECLVSVESMMNLGRAAFLAEAGRVLVPGGVLATTGSLAQGAEATRGRLEEDAASAGLRLAAFRDITPSVVLACRLDARRRAEALRPIPRRLRRRFEDFVALPGTPTFEAYASGARTYYLAVFVRGA